MEELVIMDYSTSEVHFYKCASNVDIDDSHIRALGHNPDECFWMFGEFINVINHKGVLL